MNDTEENGFFTSRGRSEDKALAPEAVVNNPLLPLLWRIQVKEGLFTDEGRSSCEEVAHEDVVNYLEWATTKPMLWDWFARRVKDADSNKN